MSDADHEVVRYPNTGRFLLGRLRQAMTAQERRALEQAVSHTEWLDQPSRVIARGDYSDQSTMLIEGFMIRTVEQDGRRHAVSFHVPGDFVDLHCFALKRLDHNIDTVGRVKVGYVPHTALDAIMRANPHLARILWFSTLLDAAMHREWIVALEQLTTPRRIAHIFAEIWCRLDMVGLAEPNGFWTPLTQNELSQLCGATPIHTNRALQQLRRTGVAAFDRGRVSFASLERLQSYAGFSPDYLYGHDFPLRLAPDAAAPAENEPVTETH